MLSVMNPVRTKMQCSDPKKPCGSLSRRREGIHALTDFGPDTESHINSYSTNDQ